MWICISEIKAVFASKVLPFHRSIVFLLPEMDFAKSCAQWRQLYADLA